MRCAEDVTRTRQLEGADKGTFKTPKGMGTSHFVLSLAGMNREFCPAAFTLLGGLVRQTLGGGGEGQARGQARGAVLLGRGGLGSPAASGVGTPVVETRGRRKSSLGVPSGSSSVLPRLPPSTTKLDVDEAVTVKAQAAAVDVQAGEADHGDKGALEPGEPTPHKVGTFCVYQRGNANPRRVTIQSVSESPLLYP